MQSFEGIWLPLITLFRDGKVDLPALRGLVDHYIAAGIHGFVVCGTTGEPATMSEDEQLAVLDAVLEAAAGRRPAIMGLGSNDTRDALRLLDLFQQRPIAGLLAVAPYYTRPSQQGLIAHFSALARGTALPLMFYNIPYRTGVNIDLETVQALSVLPLARELFSEPNPGPVKALLAQQGLIADELRLPMTTAPREFNARFVPEAAVRNRPHSERLVEPSSP